MTQKTYTKVASSALATAIRFSPCYETHAVGTDRTGDRIEIIKEKFAKDFINLSYIVIFTPGAVLTVQRNRAIHQSIVYVFGPSTTAAHEAWAFVEEMATEKGINLATAA